VHEEEAEPVARASTELRPVVIETPRLLLREFGDADFAALYAIVSNPETMRFSDGVESESMARVRLAAFRESYAERGFGKWAVETKEEGKIVGYCGFGVEEFDGQSEPELGFRFLPAVWGLGFATEAAFGCSRYALSVLGLPRYLGFANPANVASVRVLDKIGMSPLGVREFHGYPVVVYQKKKEPNQPLQPRAPSERGSSKR
jgi:ribosomal-protein-alanine N-acetyltransferase